MNALRLTTHATVRMQQRGIPAWYLQLLMEYGETRLDGHGAERMSISKSSRRQLRGVLSQNEYAKAERYFGVYAVVATDDDAVITAAHRTHRRFH
jgi:hypothetical protein